MAVAKLTSFGAIQPLAVTATAATAMGSLEPVSAQDEVSGNPNSVVKNFADKPGSAFTGRRVFKDLGIVEREELWSTASRFHTGTYRSKEFEGFEKQMADWPLYKRFLEYSSSGVGLAYRNFKCDKALRALTNLIPSIKKGHLSTLHRTVIIDVVSKAAQYMPPEDVTKFEQILDREIEGHKLALGKRSPTCLVEFVMRFGRLVPETKDLSARLSTKTFAVLDLMPQANRIVPEISPILVDALLHRIFDPYMPVAARVVAAAQVEEALPAKAPTQEFGVSVVDDFSFADSLNDYFPELAESKKVQASLDAFIKVVPADWLNTEIGSMILSEMDGYLNKMRKMGDKKRDVAEQMLVFRMDLHREMIAALKKGLDVFKVAGDDSFGFARTIYTKHLKGLEAIEIANKDSLRPLYIMIARERRVVAKEIAADEAIDFMALYYSIASQRIVKKFEGIPEIFRPHSVKFIFDWVLDDGWAGGMRSVEHMERYVGFFSKKFHFALSELADIAPVFGVQDLAVPEGFRDYLIERKIFDGSAAVLRSNMLGYLVELVKMSDRRLNVAQVVSGLSVKWNMRAITVATKLNYVYSRVGLKK